MSVAARAVTLMWLHDSILNLMYNSLLSYMDIRGCDNARDEVSTTDLVDTDFANSPYGYRGHAWGGSSTLTAQATVGTNTAVIANAGGYRDAGPANVLLH